MIVEKILIKCYNLDCIVMLLYSKLKEDFVMQKAKKLLAVVLAVMMVVSMFSMLNISLFASAATTESVTYSTDTADDLANLKANSLLVKSKDLITHTTDETTLSTLGADVWGLSGMAKSQLKDNNYWVATLMHANDRENITSYYQYADNVTLEPTEADFYYTRSISSQIDYSVAHVKSYLFSVIYGISPTTATEIIDETTNEVIGTKYVTTLYFADFNLVGNDGLLNRRYARTVTETIYNEGTGKTNTASFSNYQQPSGGKTAFTFVDGSNNPSADGVAFADMAKLLKVNLSYTNGDVSKPVFTFQGKYKVTDADTGENTVKDFTAKLAFTQSVKSGTKKAFGFCHSNAYCTLDIGGAFANPTVTYEVTEPVCAHTNTTTTTVDASCTEAGSATVTCDDCGETVSTETIAALGHSEAEAVKENVVDATYTEEGSYDSVIYCSVCGEELSRTVVVTDKLPTGFVTEDGILKYIYEDGTYASGWFEVEGDTYYASIIDNKILTGEKVQILDTYYNFTEEGVLIGKTADVSIVLDDDGEYRYYLNGEVQTGWQYIDGYRYYFRKADGAMLRNGIYTVYSSKCVFAEDGKYIENPTYEIIDNKCYYGGIQVTGWQTVDGNEYYFKKSTGEAITNGTYTVGATKCTFDETGILVKNAPKLVATALVTDTGTTFTATRYVPANFKVLAQGLLVTKGDSALELTYNDGNISTAEGVVKSVGTSTALSGGYNVNVNFSKGTVRYCGFVVYTDAQGVQQVAYSDEATVTR